MIIDGRYRAHCSSRLLPTHAFKAPRASTTPWFEKAGVKCRSAAPRGSKPEDFPGFLRSVFQLSNIRGALITMPHKVRGRPRWWTNCPTARVSAGAWNAVRLGPEASCKATCSMAPAPRGALRKGLVLRGARASVVGSGGVGCAIAASLAAEGLSALALFDVNAEAAEGLAARLRRHYPQIDVSTRSSDPAGSSRPARERHASGHEPRATPCPGCVSACRPAPLWVKWS